VSPLRRIRAIGFAILAAWALCASGENAPTEYEVKAAYLFNFAKYLEWPADAFAGPQAPLTLCVLGRDPFGEALTAYQRRTVQGRELRVRRGAGLDDLRGCQMVFVAESEEPRLQRILRANAALPIAMVSDIDGFSDAGGMIGLVDADQRVQFDLNLASAERARIKVNSQLMRIARNTRSKLP